jgi:hypothetical protein
MFVALRNAHFAEISDEKRPPMRASATGRKPPVETICDFFSLAASQADGNGEVRIIAIVFAGQG